MKNRPVHPVVLFLRIINFVIENNAEFRRGFSASPVSCVPFGCCGCGMYLQVVLARFLSARITHVRTMIRVIGGSR